jgi:hypothetical protein
MIRMKRRGAFPNVPEEVKIALRDIEGNACDAVTQLDAAKVSAGVVKIVEGGEIFAQAWDVFICTAGAGSAVIWLPASVPSIYGVEVKVVRVGNGPQIKAINGLVNGAVVSNIPANSARCFVAGIGGWFSYA